MNARRIVPTTLVALCVFSVGLAFACVPAFAEKIYFPGVSFGGEGSGPGQFKEPVGVAVNDETEDVYVVDKGNKRVEEFTAEGDFITEFAPPGGFEDPEQIAVDNSDDPILDPSAGDVYVTDTGHKAIDKFSATGGYEGHLTEAEVCPRGKPCEVLPFGSLRGIAVDPTGDFWVYQANESSEEIAFVDELSGSGAFLETFETASNPRDNHGFAVESNGDLYLGGGVDMELERYTETGKSIVQDGHGGTIALALIPSTSPLLAGELLQDTGSVIARYTPITDENQLPLETFPGEDVPKGYEGLSGSNGIAVNASATVYASERGADKLESFGYDSVPDVITEPPSGVSETGLTLHGSVNPEGEPVKECYFEYGTEAGKYTNRAECDPPAGEGAGHIGKGTAAVPVSAVVSGLQPADVRSFRLVAVTRAGVERSGKSLTISRPVTTEEAASEVESSTATVSADINTGGLGTCYRIEYGTSLLYGTSTPERCVGPGKDERVSAGLIGLQPDTEYFFRVSARNELGEKLAEEGVVFRTFGPSTAELPDGRVDEAVSAVGSGDDTEVYVPHGMEGTLDDVARHGIFTNLPFEASSDGDTVTYVGDPPVSGGNGNEGIGGGNQYVAARLSQGGWTQVSISASGYANNYVGFSGDLSVGVLGSSERLAEDAPESYPNLYRRPIDWRGAVGGSLEPLRGSFEPLFTTPPCLPANGFGSVLNGVRSQAPLFGGGNAGTDTAVAFTHLLFEANAALPSTPSPAGCSAGNDLYDWVGGLRYLVNVLPGGRVEPNATFGRQGPDTDGFVSPEMSGTISADGSRIYWSAVEAVKVGGTEEYEERPTALYVRENDTQLESEMKGERCMEPAKACTAQVDAAEAGCSTSVCGEGKERGGRGQFWTVSGDGSEVFFTDERVLTEDSTAAPGSPDLYEYDLEAPEGERLSDLSLSAKPEPGAHAGVQGVVGRAEDGSYIYFVANGVLAEGAAPGNCDGKYEANQTCGLYVRHDGVTKFIATLSGEDGNFTHGAGGNDGDWQADPGHRTAEVTPDGHSVVFMSRRPLTGYDNVLDGVPLTEVFVYNADTEGLTCASCNQSGEAPVAPVLPEYAKNITGIWGSFLPVSDSLADYQPRVISEDGDRVFFDSIEPLVPQENGLLDVYEWEAQGEGSCREARGCVYLLSGGQSTDNSYLIDASANGDDVFFVSRAQLAKTDHGDNDVLNDARVGGVEPPAEVECSGAGCQGAPPASPIFATPASVTAGGTGNFPYVSQASQSPPTVKCPKGKKLTRGKCVKKSKPKGKRGKKAKKEGLRKKRRAARSRLGAKK